MGGVPLLFPVVGEVPPAPEGEDAGRPAPSDLSLPSHSFKTQSSLEPSLPLSFLLNFT